MIYLLLVNDYALVMNDGHNFVIFSTSKIVRWQIEL